MTDISDFVKTTMMDHLEVEEYSPSLDMYVCYGADQLDMIEILMAIEEEFGIEMPDLDYATGDDFIKAAEAA